MSTLKLATYTMPAATLGGENPLPALIPFHTPSAAAAGQARSADYLDKGLEHHSLPYRVQDQYDRERQPREFKVAVLENELLRATVLLELGGRLWSLFHKPSNTELLYVNPVFQPANLAVRDAWFSGGVEWNVGIIGHCPFTCSPLFAARASTEDGTPVLRLYEYERIRGVTFQIDMYLPEGSRFLLVRPRIVNPNGHTVPMYWWSNMAVPERKDVRIVGPAEKALRHNYNGALVPQDVPMLDGVDVTYTTNRKTAADMYLQIAKGHRPWIAALDGDGRGLVQTSTSRLYGRKAFNWGMGPGGRHWQEFLAQSGEAYIEIQGGLAPTQSIYLPMPAGAEWEWLEAYGLMEAPAERVHGQDWKSAYGVVEEKLEAQLPAGWMDAELERTAGWARRAPAELLQSGSGWGALERLRRAASDEPQMTDATPFPDSSLGEEQSPWMELLQAGRFPQRKTTSAPGAYMVQREWREKLERAAETTSNHWLTWLQLGVMRFRACDKARAGEAWRRSIELAPNGWAYRNLAVLEGEQEKHSESADLLLKAVDLLPTSAPIAVECCRALLRAGRAREVLEFADRAAPEVREHARIRLYAARAALQTGDLVRVEEFFRSPKVVPNIREKEVALSDLWFAWHEKRLASAEGIGIDEALRQRVRKEFPPPAQFDFRMSGE